MAFRRTCKDELIENLRKEPVFLEKLLPDIIAKKVFPALRPDTITFYYLGGALLSYKDNKFSTGKAYQPKDFDGDFFKNYNKIKKLVTSHKAPEASTLSGYYKNGYLFAPSNKENRGYKDFNNRYILLDIESCLQSITGKRTDELDALFMDVETKTLQFVEAKVVKNKELIKQPERKWVGEQIKRYELNLKAKEDEIIEAYKNYVQVMARLFDKEKIRENFDYEPDFELEKIEISPKILDTTKTWCLAKKVSLLIFGEKLGTHFEDKESLKYFCDEKINVKDIGSPAKTLYDLFYNH